MQYHLHISLNTKKPVHLQMIVLLNNMWHKHAHTVFSPCVPWCDYIIVIIMFSFLQLL